MTNTANYYFAFGEFNFEFCFLGNERANQSDCVRETFLSAVPNIN